MLFAGWEVRMVKYIYIYVLDLAPISKKYPSCRKENFISA